MSTKVIGFAGVRIFQEKAFFFLSL